MVYSSSPTSGWSCRSDSSKIVVSPALRDQSDARLFRPLSPFLSPRRRSWSTIEPLGSSATCENNWCFSSNERCSLPLNGSPEYGCLEPGDSWLKVDCGSADGKADGSAHEKDDPRDGPVTDEVLEQFRDTKFRDTKFRRRGCCSLSLSSSLWATSVDSICSLTRNSRISS